MYKTFTSQDLKRLIGLPEDYKVRSFISYGAWDDEKRFEDIQETLNVLGIKYTSRVMDRFLRHILEININNEIYWFAVVYGGTLLSEYLHSACLFGSERNIHIGSCGGLYPEMNSLDLVVPTFSYGTETSACMYERDKDFKYYSDENLSKQIELKIDKKYKTWRGPINSCQAMLGETLEDVKKWSEDGYYGVEMETATVFSVSNHFKVPSAALMYVSDNLIKGQTVGDESHAQQKSLREELKKDLYKIAVKTMLNII